MNNIKLWIVDSDTKGGCRFVTVDAYNTEFTRQYYAANGFKDLFSTELQEKEFLGMPPEKDLKTRIMYFDLILLKENKNVVQK